MKSSFVGPLGLPLVGALLSMALIPLHAVAQPAPAVESTTTPPVVQWQKLEAHQTTDAAGMPLGRNRVFRAAEAAGLTPTQSLFRPLIVNQGALTAYLVDLPSNAPMTIQIVQRYMQAVPGLPDGRYPNAQYDRVRNAFSAACISSVRGYRTISSALFNTLSGASDIDDYLSSVNPETYDNNCLTSLANIPVVVKRVVGLLLNSEGRAFCTATIVGPHTVLTSRHCFVDALTGEPTPVRSQVFGEGISFRTLVQHSGRDTFTIAEPAAGSLAPAPFAPPADFVLLKVKFWDFEFSAKVDTAAPAPLVLPQPLWIVGSNPTLADAQGAQSVLDTARGSAPEACAILEITPSGCMYHSCQTGPATSGAGLLMVGVNNDVSVVGVHKGPAASAAGCEDNPPIDLQINLAARINSAQLGLPQP